MAVSTPDDGEDVLLPGLWAWGSGHNGELGMDKKTLQEPERINGKSAEYFNSITFTSIAVGAGISAGFDKDGQLYLWGKLERYGIVMGLTTPALDAKGWVPVKLEVFGTAQTTDKKFPRVAADAVCFGLNFTVAHAVDGRLFSWGLNDRGQLGHSPQNSVTVPHLVKGLDVSVTQVSCGHSHSLALGAGGEVYSWGAWDNGRLGRPSQEEARMAKIVPRLQGKRAVEVACGGQFSLARMEDGTVYGWGASGSGQTGTGSTNDVEEPVLVKFEPEVRIKMLACGNEHSLAVDDTGKLWAWGRGTSGALGNVSIEHRPVPVRVRDEEMRGDDGVSPPKRSIVQIACSKSNSYARLDDGSVWSWGAPLLCGLNEPAGFCLWQPKRIARFGARVVTQISVSPQHCLALTTPESEAAAAREEAAGRMPNVPLQEKERLYRERLGISAPPPVQAEGAATTKAPPASVAKAPATTAATALAPLPKRKAANEQRPVLDWSSSSDKEEKEEEDTYIAEAILDSLGEGTRAKYLVKWEGYPRDQATWEPYRNVKHLDVFQDFLKARESGPKAPSPAVPPARGSAKRQRREAALAEIAGVAPLTAPKWIGRPRLVGGKQEYQKVQSDGFTYSVGDIVLVLGDDGEHALWVASIKRLYADRKGKMMAETAWFVDPSREARMPAPPDGSEWGEQERVADDFTRDQIEVSTLQGKASVLTQQEWDNFPTHGKNVFLVRWERKPDQRQLVPWQPTLQLPLFDENEPEVPMIDLRDDDSESEGKDKDKRHTAKSPAGGNNKNEVEEIDSSSGS